MGTAITVTDEHIAAGRPGECSECPVALAVRAAFPHAQDIVVTGLNIRMTDRGRRIVIPLPEEAGNFIAAFDNGEIVHAFSFTVEYLGGPG